jgi:hypothetical protein
VISSVPPASMAYVGCTVVQVVPAFLSCHFAQAQCGVGRTQLHVTGECVAHMSVCQAPACDVSCSLVATPDCQCKHANWLCRVVAYCACVACAWLQDMPGKFWHVGVWSLPLVLFDWRPTQFALSTQRVWTGTAGL